MVDFLKIPQCCNYKCVLKDRSKHNSRGKNKIIYMTESILPAINFESVRDKYCEANGNKQGVGAVDAGTMLGTQATLVEFKNGVLDTKEIHHLYHQVDGSIEVMKNYLNLTEKIIMEEVDFILDFNMDKNNIADESISPSNIELDLFIVSRGTKSFPLFGLDIYCGIFRNVYTMPKEEFNEMVAKL